MQAAAYTLIYGPKISAHYVLRMYDHMVFKCGTACAGSVFDYERKRLDNL